MINRSLSGRLFSLSRVAWSSVGLALPSSKKSFWGHFKEIADGQKFGHAGQGLTVGNALHVGAAVPQIKAHAVFGSSFFQA